MSVDVRKTLTDAGYIAVGVGVLSFQQVQTRRREFTDRISANGSPLHAVSEQTKDLRLKVKSNLDRAKPAVDQVIDRIEALPEPVAKAAEPIVHAAKQLVTTKPAS